MSKMLDLENSFFPEILKEMFVLVKQKNIDLKTLDRKYGQRLTRLMSRKKYQYLFVDYIKWGGEALLLKLQEKSGTGRTVAAKIANPCFNASGKRDVFIDGPKAKDFEVREINSFDGRFKRGMRHQLTAEDGIVFTHGEIPKIIEISEKPLYFIMQYINGLDYDIWISRAPLHKRLEQFEKILKFFGELHLHGIFHRDV